MAISFSGKAISRENKRKQSIETTSLARKVPSLRRIKSDGPEVIETLIVVPPDGGWGWLVVLTSFICNFTADGTMYTFGLFLDDISLSIGCTSTQIVLANSLMTGFYYLSGPFISALTNRFGYRVVSILGGLISCASILLTSFATELVTILLVYGIGGGVGFGMMYMPSIIVIGFYFERWRAIATSIAVCGSSLGIICFPLLFTNVMANAQWRSKFKILSASCFLCACCSVLYRPLHPVRVVSVDDKKVKFADGKESYTSVYLDDERETNFSKYHNIGYPTTADIHGRSTITLAGPRRISSASIFLNTSGPSTSTIKSNIKGRPSSAQLGILKTVYEEEEYGNNRLRNCCILCKSRFCCKCPRRTRNIAPSRPLYRDDIFYSGSLAILPEYLTSMQSSLIRYPSYEKSAIEYHLSVTRITTQRDIEEMYTKCVCCPESMKRTLATMLDFNLLKSPSFLLLSFSGFFTILGLYTPFLFIQKRAMLYGMEAQTAPLLLSTLGIANTIGRIASGIFSSIPNVKALLVSYVNLLVCGCATVAYSMSYAMWWQFGYATVYGMSIACVASLRPIILVDMLGLDKLTNGFGLSLLFQGIASLVGIPLSGILKEFTRSYDTPFYFAGAVIMLSAIMLIPLDRIVKWEKMRNATS